MTRNAKFEKNWGVPFEITKLLKLTTTQLWIVIGNFLPDLQRTEHFGIDPITKRVLNILASWYIKPDVVFSPHKTVALASEVSISSIFLCLKVEVLNFVEFSRRIWFRAFCSLSIHFFIQFIRYLLNWHAL